MNTYEIFRTVITSPLLYIIFILLLIFLFRKLISELLKKATKISIKKDGVEIETAKSEKTDFAQPIKSSELLPPSESLVLHLPPKRHSELMGRDIQVAEAVAALRDLTAKWIVAIDGMGGIGKTALAWEVAHKCLSERLFNAVIWESAKGEEFLGESIQSKPVTQLTFELVLDAIAQHFGNLEILKLKGGEKRDKVRSLLKMKRV